MNRRYTIACLCLGAVLACYSGRTSEQAIQLVKGTSARALDQTLPTEPFDKWLRTALGVETIDWKAVRGCGDPQGARPDDLCVMAVIPVRPATNVGVFVFVGKTNKLSAPKIDLLFVERTDAPGYREYASLHELVAALQ